MNDMNKVMFEIYRDPEFQGRYHVVYFTELDDQNRDKEIPCAMRGTNIFDGFLVGSNKDVAKSKIDKILKQLNEGINIPSESIQHILKDHLEV